MPFHVKIGSTKNMKPILLWLSIEPQYLYLTHYEEVNSQDMLSNTQSLAFLMLEIAIPHT